jgi:hypothetical protein
MNLDLKDLLLAVRFNVHLAEAEPGPILFQRLLPSYYPPADCASISGPLTVGCGSWKVVLLLSLITGAGQGI